MRAAWLIGATVGLLAGCSTLENMHCEVEDSEVRTVRELCESEYEGQALESALSSLEREVRAYESTGDCKRFRLFLKSHCT